MTPSQLRAFVAVVRLGSVKVAAGELGVTEAAVSGHVAHLRKELDDPLFTRSASGLAFTPGGLRLATRAAEMLGLADQTFREVSEAGQGRRMLRLVVSSLFGEYAAPGLIELFANRAADLEVELSVCPTSQFASLLSSRAADVAVGPKPEGLPDTLVQKPLLKYQMVVVSAPDHPMAGTRPPSDALRRETWLLGPSAAEARGATVHILDALGVPEERQRIFQSHAAALEETKRGNGLAVAVGFAVASDVAQGRLVRIDGWATQSEGLWTAMTVSPANVTPAAAELIRFITTPRATQAMLHGSGATVGRFRPKVHVTLWS
jgi:DNA-binding transcriptional LysR family regulator